VVVEPTSHNLVVNMRWVDVGVLPVPEGGVGTGRTIITISVNVQLRDRVTQIRIIIFKLHDLDQCVYYISR